MALLRVRKGPTSGAVHVVFDSGSPTILGRAPEVDVPLADARASRRNSAIRRVAGQWTLEDLKSANGTFLQAKRIESAPIPDGAAIQVGSTLLEFSASALEVPSTARIEGARLLSARREVSGVFTFHARQDALDRDVRIDWLHPARAADPTLAEAVRLAVEAAGSLNDPGFLPLVQAELSAGSPLHLVFKGAPHLTLAESLPRILEQPLEVRVRLFRQMVEAILERVEAAAAPAILSLRAIELEFDAEGMVSVYLPPIDLGLLTAAVRGETANVPEFADYRAPEFGRGPALSAVPTAIYALGALGYHLFTGRRPAGDGDMTSVLENHRTLEPAPAALIDPRIPSALSDLLSDMLQKDPARRPADVAGVVSRIPTLAAQVVPASPAPLAAVSSPQPAPPRTVRPTSARPVVPRTTAARPPRRTDGSTNGGGSASAPLAIPSESSKIQSILLVPVWLLIGVVLFFAAREITKIVCRAVEGP